MYRLRSTDVWYNAPGIVAAYQPIAAPDSLAARQNVGNDLRIAGRNTAQPGVMPTWSGKGWEFNGLDSHLTTGIIPASVNWSMFVRYSNAAWHPSSSTYYGAIVGSYSVPGDHRFTIYACDNSKVSLQFGNDGYAYGTPLITQGITGFARDTAYLNGVAYPTKITPCVTPTKNALFIGAHSNWEGGVGNKYYGAVQTLIIVSITLSPAHVAQYSSQMQYCHVNPDWSAWGRRRRYYYAPSAVAGILWRGVGRNSSPVGGSPGIGRST